VISIETIDALTAGRFGIVDAACPLCAPMRRSAANRRRRTLRVWRDRPDFASYCCARCGTSGYARDERLAMRGGDAVGALEGMVGTQTATSGNIAQAASARASEAMSDERAAKLAAAAEHLRIHQAQRLSLARSLWQRRQPLAGTIAEAYLRDARSYHGPLPATLGFLPARGEHAPAMIAAFGMAHETEPGVLAIGDGAVTGVHLTKLSPNGSGKAGTSADKIMLGASGGSPIVLAPANDLLGLAIAEGIEDALSMHVATGLGVWAAGSAGRMPALGDLIPSYIECVTIAVDDDEAGRRGADGLSAILVARGIEVRLCRTGSTT
jgi:hypothetical protein